MTTSRMFAFSRDQIVAALIVGAVVVLLSFASGLGVPVAAPSAAAQLPAPKASGPALVPTFAESSGVSYVAVPPPGGGAIPAGDAPIIGATAPAVANGTATRPPALVPSPPTARPGSPGCPQNVLSDLLDALAPPATPPTAGLPSLLDLLGLTPAPSHHAVLRSIAGLTPRELLQTVTRTLSELPLVGGLVGARAPAPGTCAGALRTMIAADR